MTTARAKPGTAATTTGPARTGDTGLCFMETQFPVSKLSKESYKERKAVSGQTLTGLGKWWGRKPLVLCRATILGLLLPASDDPQKDREVFLRLMTMDDDGMLRRWKKTIPSKVVFSRLPPRDRARYFTPDSDGERAAYSDDITREEKQALQRRVFLSMSYDERLEYCDRPEQIEGPSPESWRVINAHLGTSASNLPELVAELGRRRFGHVPRVGDAFCGGGSVPFEAARLGCNAFGSDLSPVAALLTWAALNIVGGGDNVAREVQDAQRRVYEAVDRQLAEWGVEHREPDPKTNRRWRAEAYLYCVEVQCPECGWRVPLAPSWVIAEKTNVVGRLVPDEKHKRYDFVVESNVSSKQMQAAKDSGTVKDSELVCPRGCQHTPVSAIRGDGRGTFGPSQSLLRPWDNCDVMPRGGDIFGERLYCVRWIDRWIDKKGKQHADRYYLAPTPEDLRREKRAHELLMERFEDWQASGYIPSRRIEPGDETARLQRERGWTYWHHLFTARQLLTHGLFAQHSAIFSGQAGVGVVLLLGRLANWNSRLCRWQTGQGGGIGGGKDTFSNQALNTLYNYCTRGFVGLESAMVDVPVAPSEPGTVVACDARLIETTCDLWITDPPYADAICYDEISELFLVWYEGHIRRLFPDWYTDSRRALAVKGQDESFTRAMVDCYHRLAERMPEHGMQVVMFTHQDAGVWADLALILWAAGLRVSAAWCIATETGPAVGEGNYVQGTVLLALRKRTDEGATFLDEVYQDVEVEVRRQLDSMLALDDKDDPNFGDTDYQLAAYAAALRVLTSRKIEEIDVAHELTKVRAKGEISPVEALIESAVRIACDHLVPRGIDGHLWKSLTATERFYLKGLEMESHGEYRNGVYQELARGFGLEEYTPLLAGTKANQTRLKTASEFGRRELGDHRLGAGATFANTLVRHALFATFKTAETEATRDGMQWLHDELPDYWGNRQRLIGILEFLAALGRNASLTHWHKDAEAAGLLAGAVRNDHV